MNVGMFGYYSDIDVTEGPCVFCSMRPEKIYGYNSILVFEVTGNVVFDGVHFINGVGCAVKGAIR